MITQFYLPTRLIFGTSSISQLGAEAKKIGKKAMLVTYPDIRKIGLLDNIIDDLNKNGVASLTFDEVMPNPRSSMIDHGAEIYRQAKADLIIGIGGGSAMDAAKGIAFASTGTEPIWSYIKVKGYPFIDLPVTPPPIIQVPTMAGTGAEMNGGAVITNWETHEKHIIMNSQGAAKVVILDPALTITVPRKSTARGGLDTFSHLAEPYLASNGEYPVNDVIRESLMKIVVEYLPIVLERLDDINGRSQLSWASTIAMSSFAQLGGGSQANLCHGIAHAVSGLYDIAHADSVAALLPHWMRFIQTTNSQRIELFGKNAFGKADGIIAFEEWLEKIGMRIKLSDVGCNSKDARQIANSTIETSLVSKHPIQMDIDTIADIYLNAC